MERFALVSLSKWKKSKSRKPLIIQGARQVGKTWLMKEFGRREYEQVAYINFESSDSLKSIFKDNFDVNRLITAFQIETGIRIRPENTLIILDEILKGTNSVDKLQGSQKLVKRLIDNNATAIIATHDLKLTDMANEYPESVKNQCFEIEISNNEMHFDYKLRNGVTNTMNATFLMKKMGIIE